MRPLFILPHREFLTIYDRNTRLPFPIIPIHLDMPYSMDDVQPVENIIPYLHTGISTRDFLRNQKLFLTSLYTSISTCMYPTHFFSPCLKHRLTVDPATRRETNLTFLQLPGDIQTDAGPF